jgi:2-oxoglutarate ferredoxin oxidoreductase subunit delta
MCPQNVLAKSKKVDNRGFFIPESVNLSACTVCHICELECPDFAIKVVEK